MKILIVVDKTGSAIDRLSQSIKKHNTHLDIQVLPLHPKRPSIEEVDLVVKAFNECDLLHVAYWKSGEKLKEFVDISSKKKILCHYNPYDIDKEEVNKQYDLVVVGNEEMSSKLAYAHLIPYCIDLDFWTFNEEYTKDRSVCMVVARIEGKKGVKEVAKACSDLGYRFDLVGRISDQNYFNEIKAVNPNVIFHEDITDKELLEIYYKSAIHICNSVDNFESGTLPILEAMACGVPVLTRIIGHVKELYDGGNMVVRGGSSEDIDELRKELEELMENIAQREKIRDKAWDTVKNRNDKKMARQFERLYHKVLKDNKPLVSVIMPTFDRPDVLLRAMSSVIAQDYPYIELVIADSGNTSVKPLVEEFKRQTNIPIKYIRFDNRGEYTLAKARNLAVMESIGDLLVFCDERIAMESRAVGEFVRNWRNRSWLWGIKDDSLKGFVENFSCIAREEFIRSGMFNERIDGYGGMSQEVRTRLEGAFDFAIVNTAFANAIARTKGKASRRKSIIESKLKLFKMYGK